LRHVVAGAAGGITRQPAGHGFSYHRHGQAVTDEKTLQRIGSLAIPPAWREVWICSDPDGHLQAVGRDARHRKQYRYHPRWRARRDDTKFHRMLAFGKALPRLRARVLRDLARRSLAREKVLATVVRLLETTLIRVGNDEYARQNHSFGLTTLEDRHVAITGADLRFHFRGKSGKEHTVTLHDPRLASIVKQCRDIPGYDLFQFIDESGRRQSVDSADVNDYIREAMGDDFTAKDFRTWAGTVLAARALATGAAAGTEARTRKAIASAIGAVAAQLGNTVAVCRKSYIHPAILDCYREGQLARLFRHGPSPKTKVGAASLRADEKTVLALLQRRPAEDRGGQRLQRQLRRSLRPGAARASGPGAVHRAPASGCRAA
jgi:DNA topoisomerase-1